MVIGYLILTLDITLFYIAIFVYDYIDVYETILSSFNYKGSLHSRFLIIRNSNLNRISEFTDVSLFSSDEEDVPVGFWVSDYWVSQTSIN